MSCDTWVSSSEKSHSVLWAGPVSLHCWGDRSSLSGAVDLSRDRVGWHTHWEGYTLCGHNLLYVTLILLSVDMEFIKKHTSANGRSPRLRHDQRGQQKGRWSGFYVAYVCVSTKRGHRRHRIIQFSVAKGWWKPERSHRIMTPLTLTLLQAESAFLKSLP